MVVIAVNIDCASLQSVDEFESSIDVGSNYSCSEPIGESIGPRDDIFFVAPAEDAHDWSEYFFFCDFHVILDFGEDGRLNEISLLAQSASAHYDFGSFFLALLDIVEDAFELFLADDGAQLVVLVEGVTHFEILGVLDASLDKFIVDGFMDVGARASYAALAVIPE